MSQLIITEATAEGPHFFRDQYVERWWGPVLGPTSLLLGRHIAFELDCVANGSVALDPEALAWHLGNANQERLERALDRLCTHGPLRTTTYGWTMPVYVTPVPERFMRRWPDAMREMHARELAYLADGGKDLTMAG